MSPTSLVEEGKGPQQPEERKGKMLELRHQQLALRVDAGAPDDRTRDHHALYHVREAGEEGSSSSQDEGKADEDAAAASKEDESTGCILVLVLLLLGCAGNAAQGLRGGGTPLNWVFFTTLFGLIYLDTTKIWARYWKGETVAFWCAASCVLVTLTLACWCCTCLMFCGVFAVVVANPSVLKMVEKNKEMVASVPDKKKRHLASAEFRQYCDRIFDEADADKNGKLHMRELEPVVLRECPRDARERARTQNDPLFLQAFDKDKNSAVDKEEFCEMMKYFEMMKDAEARGGENADPFVKKCFGKQPGILYGNRVEVLCGKEWVAGELVTRPEDDPLEKGRWCVQCMRPGSKYLTWAHRVRLPLEDKAAEKAMIEKINGLLSEEEGKRRLRAAVARCWETARTKEHLDLEIFARELGKEIEMPPSNFGDLTDVLDYFDFDGSGSLELNEAHRWVKRQLDRYRRELGGHPDVLVRLVSSAAEEGYSFTSTKAKGGQGTAHRVTDKEGKEKMLKVYKKDFDKGTEGGLDELKSEMEFMRELGKCPQVASVHDIFQDKASFYLVSDWMRGGEFTTLRAKASAQGVAMDEAWWRAVFAQAFTGLEHMHRNAIMHCDIKEPNLMLRNDDFARPEVVIIDLGICQCAGPRNEMGIRGTMSYIPPETWTSQKWLPVGDIWSMGVVCMQLLTDKVPHPGAPLGQAQGLFLEGCKTVPELVRSIQTRRPPFEQIKPHSPALQEWLEKVLEKEPARRLRAKQVLQMPWFKSEAPKEGGR